MSEQVSTTPYQVPERFSTMTVHFLGSPEASESVTTESFLDEHKFALLADLSVSDIPKVDIETAVNSGRVAVAHWPEKEPLTDLFWKNDEAALAKLTELADMAVQFCYGQDEHQPVGGNFVTVGAEMGSQQLAIVGLIYAREQGRLREMTELADENGGTGPLYVVRNCFSSKMFEILFPEE